LTLYHFKLRDLNVIASGGNVLSLFEINYAEHDLNLFFNSKINKKITKIILIKEVNSQLIWRIVLCDQEGYIALFDISNDRIISSRSTKKCHNSKIYYILYLPN